ncbi:MAG: abortive infection system antitoxin AbiGi family protein [Candidatus Sericytochromatia bacterium]
MKNLSSDILFHFTSCYDVLEKILKSGFLLSNSVENFSDMNANSQSTHFIHPMVCFCDIRISQIDLHTEHYGKFAIGMSKKCGINKKLNTVSYFNKNSIYFDNLRNLFNDQTKGNQFVKFTPEEIMILKYLKEYEGYFHKIRGNKIFYDEREWRFVLDQNHGTQHQKLILPFKNEDDHDKLEEIRKKINDNNKKEYLEIDLNEIECIIVEKNSDLNNLVTFLKNESLEITVHSPIISFDKINKFI